MPLKIKVGVCRTIGLSSYGSIEATCNLDLQLSPSLLQDDPDAFQRHVRNAYVACEKAVDDQLAECQANLGNGQSQTPSAPP